MGLLDNKIALVTGTNRGIGKAIIEAFAREGAIVYANARQTGSLELLSEKINQECHGKIIPVYFDVTDVAKIKFALMEIRKAHGQLNILVNNAGIMSNQLLGSITIGEINKLFSVNVYSVLQLMQYSVKLMKENSSIINISSIVGERGSRGQILYSATKGAVIALTKSAAKELAEKKIRVNSVAPGLTDTDGLQSTDAVHLSERIKNLPFGRVADVKDIANACVFLGSDMSTYISGEIIGVNGSAIM